ncbi:hypothetical protein GN244_ATG06473 [Phytophthora infestans]|uniref:Uncharacterized protein n=1 Tax=Phytophthora infestans TaxID=4787 RepID=A0A833SHS1_PHYIN|nr:hypothetical protein GN244_ATG06473 [Phytophthora infestans]KAF4149702.1 hypothetical protein GN958_ATG01098 [Phytophthora infestans]
MRFAQVAQAWMEQRLRNTDSEVYKLYQLCLRLNRGVNNLKSSDTALRNEVMALKESLVEVNEVLDKAGPPGGSNVNK